MENQSQPQLPKHPRPVTVPGPGDGTQPVRFLQPFLLGAFENASPDFIELLQDQIQFRTANPAITYDVRPVRAYSPQVDGTEGTISLGETFLSYVWAVTYSTLVAYDEVVARPRITPDFERTPAQQALITDATYLLYYGISLFRELSPWPLAELPNPELYNADEAHYVGKADAVFVHASVLVLIHEYAHYYLGHLENDEEHRAAHTSATEAEYKADEEAADKFAIEVMLEGAARADEPTRNTIRLGIVMGLGAILLPAETLDGGSQHPDPHHRLQAGLEAINPDVNDNLWGVGSMLLSWWAMLHDMPPVGGNPYTTLKELFEAGIAQLDRNPVYRRAAAE